jgi:hypothetical protein
MPYRTRNAKETGDVILRRGKNERTTDDGHRYGIEERCSVRTGQVDQRAEDDGGTERAGDPGTAQNRQRSSFVGRFDGLLIVAVDDAGRQLDHQLPKNQ